jgi:hypothetical protein
VLGAVAAAVGASRGRRTPAEPATSSTAPGRLRSARPPDA